ncbi:MAG: glycosyltransferase family 2 protein [Acidobacteria bacterium]|nr:glycosyltransferase family 2 protein [Acidobacteriota bacterium]
MSLAPRVSVVIATYNRSNVLRHTLTSLLSQTVADFEAIVVGDACSDDTAEVVASFSDPRLVFRNLAANVGDQSGPNNVGMAAARAPVIAFLNHDDLWFPDHLERGLALLDAEADVALAGWVRGPAPERVVAARGAYSPHQNVPASAWVFRAGLRETVGPWRHRRELFNIPSQDWLFRAYRKGLRLRHTGIPTLLVVNSVVDAGSYALRLEERQAAYLEAMRDPAFRERLEPAAPAAPSLSSRLFRRRDARSAARTASYLVRSAPERLLSRIAPRFGISPLAVTNVFRFGFRRGEFLERLRHRRGLPHEAHGMLDE